MSFEDKLHVMLVEDTPVIQDLVLKMLNRFNCHVQTANDGMVALQHFKKFHFDLILMDINMPRMNGYETASTIREKQEGKNVKSMIVALTSLASPEEIEESYRAGMDDHLVKPFAVEDLKKAMEEAKGKRFQTCKNCYYQRTCIHQHRPNRGMACWKKGIDRS